MKIRVARQRNSRVILVKALKEIVGEINNLRGWWQANGSREVWEFDAPRDERGNVPRHQRRSGEYPEAEAANWAGVATWAAHWRNEMERIERFAREQERTTREAGR